MEIFGSQDLPVWLPMAASIVTGAAIGFERELKAKAAGLRTHTLVCFSSALLMMAAGHQADWVFNTIPGTNVTSDPTRMAHGILTGIGFLGAGVIFKQGNAVRGLTTAASIWMTAALGVLYGAGLTWLAVSGTVSALFVLVIFRLVNLIIPDRIEVIAKITCNETPDPARITAILADHSVKAGESAIHRKLSLGTQEGQVEVTSQLWLRDQGKVHEIDRALRTVPGVLAIAIAPATEVSGMSN